MIQKMKSSFWSYFFLLIMTGIFGSVFVAIIGKICSKLFKIPDTTFDNYGWRGISVCLIGFGLMSVIIGILVTIDEGLSHVVSTLMLLVIFSLIPIYFGIKFLKHETINQ